jgi:hypothetical protein
MGQYKPEGNELLERHRSRYQDNIKLTFKEI